MFNVDAAVRIDNVQFACGGLSCGFIDRVPVFIDSLIRYGHVVFVVMIPNKNPLPLKTLTMPKMINTMFSGRLLIRVKKGMTMSFKLPLVPGLSATDPFTLAKQ